MGLVLKSPSKLNIFTAYPIWEEPPTLRAAGRAGRAPAGEGPLTGRGLRGEGSPAGRGLLRGGVACGEGYAAAGSDPEPALGALPARPALGWGRRRHWGGGSSSPPPSSTPPHCSGRGRGRRQGRRPRTCTGSSRREERWPPAGAGVRGPACARAPDADALHRAGRRRARARYRRRGAPRSPPACAHPPPTPRRSPERGSVRAPVAGALKRGKVPR